MQYLGGKGRIAKHLVEILNKNRKPNQLFVDAMAGAFSMTCAMDGRRLANEINPCLTALFHAAQEG